MEIREVEIKNISALGLKSPCEGVRHIKTLPCLSVVQSVHGCYEIGLNGNKTSFTDKGGAFVAPAGALQEIIHHNGELDYMEAQWVFMNIIINGTFNFEDVFDIPLLISANYSQKLYELIEAVKDSADICKKYAAAYELTDLLIKLSVPKEHIVDDSVLRLKSYIDKHYHEKITKTELSNVVGCSASGLYRIFSKNFELSPNNYINKIRLEKASLLLENGTATVAEISDAVGFEDPVYFSKLFKEKYLLSPKKYREAVKNG